MIFESLVSFFVLNGGIQLTSFYYAGWKEWISTEITTGLK